MLTPELSAFCDRVVANKPEDKAAYIRIRVGENSRRTRVAATGITLHEDAAKLADEIASRLEQVADDPTSPLAYVEAICRGESNPFDSLAIRLESSDLAIPDTSSPAVGASSIEQATAWLLARQGDALVRIAQQSAHRAESAENRAATLVHELAQLQTEVEVARLAQTDDGSMMRALEAASPLLTAAAARMMGARSPESQNALNGPAEPSEAIGSPLDFEAVEAELVDLWAELEPQQRSRLLETLGGTHGNA